MFCPEDVLVPTEVSRLVLQPSRCQPEPMPEGPDITRLAHLIGDPARSSILSALMSGQALTATELSKEAAVTPSTTSGHLSQLLDAGLIWQRKQGRHRYYALAGEDVAHALETLAGLAASKGHLRSRPGPRDIKLREARVCYDHLAGARGVQVFDSLARRDLLTVNREDISLTDAGKIEMTNLGIDLAHLASQRRPLCRACLDWSERRSHLAGALGAALFDHMLEIGWLKRRPDARDLVVSQKGQQAFDTAFPV